jgi:hypothetical protein
VSRTADGLRELLALVQLHCANLNMKLSIPKCKVMSKAMELWEIIENDEVAGCMEKVIACKYLGIETQLSPFLGATAMGKRAEQVAKKYKAACMRIARDGPDVVEVAMTLWLNVACPSILFGCESVPFTETCIAKIEQFQTAIGKDALGLPVSAPNLAARAILGLRSFKELLFSAQLKFLVRLRGQEVGRWSHDAFLDHLHGGWNSPFFKNIARIKMEVGMVRGPVSIKHVDVVLKHHFLAELNQGIALLDLPGLLPVDWLRIARHVNETSASKVRVMALYCVVLGM